MIVGAWESGGPYGGIVEILALTGQRREEVAECPWDELDLDGQIWTLPKSRTKNGKAHIVHLSEQSVAVLKRLEKKEPFAFSTYGTRPFQAFSEAKRELDKICGVKDWRLHDLRRTCVSGMARLGVPPHVADKILNHQGGTISGVAAVYQRHDFLSEFVDYAGTTLDVVDETTGEIHVCQLFVAVLGTSNFTYVEATFTQRLVDWIGSHVRALEFFGGVTATSLAGWCPRSVIDTLRASTRCTCTADRTAPARAVGTPLVESASAIRT